jgi:hypothetical protein
MKSSYTTIQNLIDLPLNTIRIKYWYHHSINLLFETEDDDCRFYALALN